MVWRVLSVVLILVTLLAAPASAADSLTVSSIGEKLVCQCGCNQTVAACPDSPCPSADPIKALIGQKLAQGESEEQIIRYFVAQYSEQVLVTPTKSGFNLVAWILPFMVMLVGGGIIYLSLKKWVWQGNVIQTSTEAMPEEDEEDEEKYRRRLERELKNFSEKGFR